MNLVVVGLCFFNIDTYKLFCSFFVYISLCFFFLFLQFFFIVSPLSLYFFNFSPFKITIIIFILE